MSIKAEFEEWMKKQKEKGENKMKRYIEELKYKQECVVDDAIREIDERVSDLKEELIGLDVDDFDNESDYLLARRDILSEIDLLLFDRKMWVDEYELIENGASELCLTPGELYLGE